ncbi:MAG: hypothetical protein ACLFQT_08910 [Thiohalophilus sp.]
MRYRTGSDPRQAQEQVDGMIVGSAIFGLFTEMVFVPAGIRARQFWLALWGAGLVLASCACLIHTFFK